MNADERFMDALLERILGDVQAPELTLPATPPAQSVTLSTRPWRTRRWMVTGAAAVLLLALGAILITSSGPSDSRPDGVSAPATARIERVGSALRVTEGYALVDDTAAPVVFADGVVQPVGGQVVVVAGTVPEGTPLKDMLAWLTGPGGVNPDLAAALASPAQWFQGRETALALISGGLLISGSEDISWAGRTWSRDRVDAPPRVALVASRDAVGRLGRLTNAMKVADVDAGGAFVAALARLRSLTHVDVGSCRGVDDDAVRRLAVLDKLEQLSLADTSVGNRGLAWLSRCERLTHLDLSGLTRITSEGLAVLTDTHQHRLVRLDLRRGATIDAPALAALGRCATLQELAVSVTTALDADAWTALASLDALRLLHLDASPEVLGGAILDQLRSALPRCEIRVARKGMQDGSGGSGR